MTQRRPICSTEWGWAMASSTLWVLLLHDGCPLDHKFFSFFSFQHRSFLYFSTFLFYAWLDVTFLWVRFNILMQTKYVATLDAYVNSMSYANSRLMLTITDFSLSHAVWARYQIHDDFYFYSMTFSEVCHRYWAQTRARMSYLQICDEKS